MKTLPLLITSALFAVLANAAPAKDKIKFEDLMLEDGTVLKDAVVLKVEPDGLRLEHTAGVSKVKFEDLPEAVQKQFTFDREQAEQFRQKQEAAREEREAAERKARVAEILEKREEEQETDVQRSREAFYKLVESNEYSYPQLEKSLMDSIADLKEAGRKDLAALLEDDRKLLRERELLRPGDKYRQEREQMLARIRDLENQVARLTNNEPAVNEVHDTPVIPFFVDRPIVIDRPIVVDHTGTSPGPCPPVTRPVTRPVTVPRTHSPFVPQVSPVSPRSSSLPVAPSVPSRPVSLPSSGAQQQGAHLWKK